uniref:Uncharacterized protein n=1 Tax=Branchiostoma floridae TaxID=7739 RepID=C3ZW69_BRAFL|eukprot:XP_002587189.1 hypothetical protein BRAFLDRAFT_102074 [Branchiostoma floridae]
MATRMPTVTTTVPVVTTPLQDVTSPMPYNYQGCRDNRTVTCENHTANRDNHTASHNNQHASFDRYTSSCDNHPAGYDNHTVSLSNQNVSFDRYTSCSDNHNAGYDNHRQRGCHNGCIMHNNVCYKAFSMQMNSRDAPWTCRTKGGTIASATRKDASTYGFLNALMNGVDERGLEIKFICEIKMPEMEPGRSNDNTEGSVNNISDNNTQQQTTNEGKQETDIKAGGTFPVNVRRNIIGMISNAMYAPGSSQQTERQGYGTNDQRDPPTSDQRDPPTGNQRDPSTGNQRDPPTSDQRDQVAQDRENCKAKPINDSERDGVQNSPMTTD